MASLHHHHHHHHAATHLQQQQPLLDSGGAVHLPVQPAPPGMAAMTQEQHSATEFTHLCTTFSDCIEALPPTITRSISDLRELDAVLSGSLGTITTKLNELLALLENAEAKPEQRWSLLKEIAEEARSFRLGGEDKIRVATGTCETLIHHTNQLDVLAHLLATLLPTSMAGTVAPPSWPQGYPVLFPTQASASGSAYRKPDYLPSSTHLGSVAAGHNYPPGRHSALHQNHASAFGHVPHSLGGGNTAGGASHSLSSAGHGQYISARHAQLQDTATDAVHRYVREGAAYPDQAYIREQVQKQLNERPTYPSTSSGVGQKRQRQSNHGGNGNGKSRNGAGSNSHRPAQVPTTSLSGAGSLNNVMNGSATNGTANSNLRATSPIPTSALPAPVDSSQLSYAAGSLANLPPSSVAMSTTGSTSSQFPGGLVRTESANGRREDDPNFIPYANKSHNHTKTSLDAVSENGMNGGIGVPEGLGTAGGTAGLPQHQHRDSSSSAGTGAGLSSSAKKRRASTKDSEHLYGVVDDGEYGQGGALSPIVTTAGAAMGRERQNSGRASNGGAQSPVVQNMATSKRSRTSSKRGVDSPDPASPYLNNGNGRTPSSATFPGSVSAAVGASQRRKTSMAIYDEPEALVPELDYGNDDDMHDALDPETEAGDLEGDGEGDDTRTYCYCDRVSYGDMIGCDGEDCEREWFHLACVGLENPPKGQWYCEECAAKMGINNGAKRRRN